MRKLLAALAVTVVLVAGSVGTADAHSFGAQGPPHSHSACFPEAGHTCTRWILANGAIIQGPVDLMLGQQGYVLVWCSTMVGGAWVKNGSPWGPWGNTGNHTFCQNPKYAGTPWSLRP